MKIFTFILMICVLFFASCKIKTHIHFNKDNSGTVKITYDMSEIYASSGGQDSTGMIDSMVQSLQLMDTLSILKKYKVTKTDYGIDVSYSFENIEDLNNSFNRFMQGDNMLERATGKFTKKRNKICYELTNPTKNEEDNEVMSSMDTEGLLDWEFKISFEQKIKKCKNENYTIHPEDNSITTQGTLSKFQDPEKMNFSVKLK